jgi:hypothetical protein
MGNDGPIEVRRFEHVRSTHAPRLESAFTSELLEGVYPPAPCQVKGGFVNALKQHVSRFRMLW